MPAAWENRASWLHSAMAGVSWEDRDSGVGPRSHPICSQWGENMSSNRRGLTRRQFVSGTAAAAFGVPLIVPSTALGDEKKAAASERITLGFIGVGTMNRGHLGYFLGQKDVQVVA